MDIQFLGGASEVGRLAMLYRRDGATLLFDYGVLPKDPPQYPMEPPPVDLVALSHAHLDHSGLIPRLCGRSDTPWLATPPTAEVGDLLMEDSLKVSSAEGFPAPYSRGDLTTARRSVELADFGDTVEADGVELTLHSAGHIPGATMYEVNGPRTLLFTGDVHTLTTELVHGAQPVPCDVLVIESTYAGRNHPQRKDVEAQLIRKVEEVVDRGGLAVVPAFAVGRTQEVLLVLARTDLRVWVDGMGKAVNSIYMNHRRYVRDGKRLRRATQRALVPRRPNGRNRVLDGDAIVTTSGMLDGGPVLQYVEAIRDDPRSAILLTGYQVEGTNGRRLVEQGTLDLSGAVVPVRCEVQSFDFSAHAGHDELVEFIDACNPQTVVLMHGDNRQALADALEGRECVLPMEGKTYSL